jgi:hypothetical protein
MTTNRTAEHGTFTLSRRYFAAWSSQESKARWFGAPGAPATSSARLGWAAPR